MPQKPKSNDKIEDKDLFQTPHYATSLLLPYLKSYIMIWEPAMGDGYMAEVLKKEHPVYTSDIQSGGVDVWDFITQTKEQWWLRQIGCIVTNPPFTKKQKFYQKCMYYWKQFSIPFALLIPADYSGWVISAVYEDLCQKIIPTRRIDYITPNQLQRINEGESTNYKSLREIPQTLIARYSSSKFHSLWLTKGLNIQIPKPILPSEIYVSLSIKSKKEDIL